MKAPAPTVTTQILHQRKEQEVLWSLTQEDNCKKKSKRKLAFQDPDSIKKLFSLKPLVVELSSLSQELKLKRKSKGLPKRDQVLGHTIQLMLLRKASSMELWVKARDKVWLRREYQGLETITLRTRKTSQLKALCKFFNDKIESAVRKGQSKKS